ncbi:MAG: hypothetical protein ACRDZO_19945 [Egibacteraceae bacterium]
MRIDFGIEEVLLLTILFVLAASTLVGIPIAILWFVVEVGRSAWSMRRRWLHVSRNTIIGTLVWIAIAALMALLFGGIVGALLLAFLAGVGIIALAHA